MKKEETQNIDFKEDVEKEDNPNSENFNEELNNKDLSKIENPEYPDRDQWVYDLGYKQWTEKEVRDGTVFKRFKTKLGL